jgi:SpoVK/Ycf46/Vps4 family AAA+-type ATPase
VVDKVEEHVKRELGDDIVEFKRPHHHLEDLVGFTRLKGFLRQELIPRLRASGPDAIPGAAVCGPIGGGKTFIFEAVAAELDMPVMVLKNIRSQWFGQTDVILERLKRVLDAFSKVLLFVDEADTQFGGVGASAHATERRLTGKIQGMMSDPRLRGRVVWLLMTARVHRLSPDIRRPGRVGDLIIPILDPEGKDRDDFLRWVVEPVWTGEVGEDDLVALRTATHGYFAASYASLRSELQSVAARKGSGLGRQEILDAVKDRLAPAITEARRYQVLQAMVNCTRRSLLPESEEQAGQDRRAEWSRELQRLEALGLG